MITNTVLLWNLEFQPNIRLVCLLIFGTVGIVPFIFLSYLLLYFFYNYFDIFNSNSIHVVFQPKSALNSKKTPFAQDEDVSDVEPYQEGYPDKVTEMNSGEESNPLKENELKLKGTSITVHGDWINTHISLS